MAGLSLGSLYSHIRCYHLVMMDRTFFSGELYKLDSEYIKITIKLVQDSPIKVNRKYGFDNERNYCEVKVLTGTAVDPDTGRLVRIYTYYTSSEGSIEFLKIKKDRVWAKFEFIAKDLSEGNTMEIRNGYLVNIPAS